MFLEFAKKQMDENHDQVNDDENAVPVDVVTGQSGLSNGHEGTTDSPPVSPIRVKPVHTTYL